MNLSPSQLLAIAISAIIAFSGMWILGKAYKSEFDKDSWKPLWGVGIFVVAFALSWWIIGHFINTAG